MAIYRYKAKNGPTDIVEGEVEAFTEREAIEKISRMGYLPVRLDEIARKAHSGKAQAHKPPRTFAGGVKSREITIFSRELASLLKAGVPILSGIDIISEQTASRVLKRVLSEVRDAVKEGSSFSSALERYPRIFPAIFVAMIRTGENSGQLPDILIRISDYRVKQEDLMSRFRMALAYPLLMAMVGIATIVFMLTFVMPRLTRIFTSMGQELPLPTKLLIAASSGLRDYWMWIVLAVVVMIIIIRRELNTRAGRLFFSHLKLRVPIFGKLALKADLARFSRTLELLVKSGIPILKGLEISIPVLDNEVIKAQLAASCKDLEQGGSFGRSLKGSKLFPVFMTDLIIVGEESGSLDNSLSEVANFYERDTDEAIRIFASLLEPVIILAMGLIVGFIVIAMLLPIFEINVMVR